MADIAVLGIGIDTRSGETKAANLAKGLRDVAKSGKEVGISSQAMAKAMIAANLATEALKKSMAFLVTEFKNSVQVGIQFEKTMSQVKAVSNATEVQFQDLTKAAKAMGEATMFSASEAASGLVLLSQAGLKVEQAKAALPQVLSLAAAGGLSLAEASDIATNAMSGMRMGVGDLQKITDVFAKTASSSNTNVRMMGESFTYAASIASSTGTSLEELSAMIGILGNAGIQASMAGTQLAQGISKAATEGKSFLGMLEELEARGASTAEVMDVFGEKAGRGALAILGQGTATVRAFQQELLNAEGAAKKMADTMQDNLAGDLKTLESALEAVRIDVFEVFSKDFRQVTQSITAFVRENKDEIVSYAESLKTTAKEAFLEMKRVYEELVTAGTPLNLQMMELRAVLDETTAAVLLFTKTTIAASDGVDILFTAVKSTTNIIDLLNILVNGLVAAGETIKSISAFGGAMWTSFTGTITGNVKKQVEAMKVATMILYDYGDTMQETRDRMAESWNRIMMEEKSGASTVIPQRKKLIEVMQQTAEATKEATKTQEEAVRILGIPMTDVTEAQELLAIVTDGTTEAIKKQIRAVATQTDSLTTYAAAAEKAAEAVGKFSGSSLAGQTFTVTRGVADTAGVSMPTVSSATSATTAPSMAGILKRAEALQYAFLAEDQLLSEMRQKLIKTAEDYGKISKDSLEEQLDNLEEQQRIIKQIEDIENRQNTEKLSNLAKQDALLTQFSEEAAKLAMEGLIPKDLLDATKAQYADLQKQVNEIDFSTITESDTALLAKFKESAEAYLDSAASVWKSSEQYQVIKDEIEGQFSAIAASIKTQMAPATFAASSAANAIGGVGLAMTAIKQNEPGATAALTDIAAGASTLNQAAGGLTGGLSQAAAAAGQTSSSAIDLKSDLTAATKPFDNMTVSIQTFADQIKAMATQISQSAAGTVPAGGGAIPTGGGTAGTTTAATFQKYIVSSGNLYRQMSDGQILPEMKSYLGKGFVKALSDDGLKAVWDTEQTSIGAVRYYAFRAGESTPAKAVYVPNSGMPMAPGFDSFATGSWGIRGTTPAMLHDGEMVIRRDDAPVIRSVMQSMGMTSGYAGATSTGGNMAKSESMMEQMVMLLAEIAGSIGILGSRPVTVDVRRVSDALDRFQRTRGAA